VLHAGAVAGMILVLTLNAFLVFEMVGIPIAG